jgi:hypothetical protein
MADAANRTGPYGFTDEAWNLRVLQKGAKVCLRSYQLGLSGSMTAFDLEELLIARLVRERGGTSQTWQHALGKVIVRDTDTHAHCPWDVRLGGTYAQRAAIERLLDDVRLEHPILAAG